MNKGNITLIIGLLCIMGVVGATVYVTEGYRQECRDSIDYPVVDYKLIGKGNSELLCYYIDENGTERAKLVKEVI